MVIDYRLGNASLFGYLQGGGAVEALLGKQQRGGRFGEGERGRKIKFTGIRI
jgi:hypothetical protein